MDIFKNFNTILARSIYVREIPKDLTIGFDLIRKSPGCLVYHNLKTNTIRMFSRDRIKIEWISIGLNIGNVVKEYESTGHKINKQNIYVLDMPYLLPLNRENKKLANSILKYFYKVYDYFYKKRETYDKYWTLMMFDKVIRTAERNKNDQVLIILSNLFKFLNNYNYDEYMFDLELRNFMQDADNNLILIDPIITAGISY